MFSIGMLTHTFIHTQYVQAHKRATHTHAQTCTEGLRTEAPREHVAADCDSTSEERPERQCPHGRHASHDDGAAAVATVAYTQLPVVVAAPHEQLTR